MKLSEIKVLSNGEIMLSNGYYLQKDEQEYNNAKTWGIKRLMHDGDIGEAAIIAGMLPGDHIFKMSIYKTDQKISTPWRAVSNKMVYENFYDWCDKQINILEPIDEDLASDLNKARKARRIADKEVWLHRLNKDGKESGMHDAKTYFDDIDDAIKQHNYRVDANPNKEIMHNLVTHTEAFGPFKKKLVGKVKQ